ncbi:MAG: universal stress protein [Propionivibrio sp.]
MAGPINLLAATDFSSSARHAAERAALISGETGARLELLHVLSLAPLQELQRLVTDLPAGFAEEAVSEEVQVEMDALAASLQAKYAVKPDCRIVRGALLSTLHAEAVASGADLLVFGARGESVFRHVLLGTTAMRMVSKSRQPILVVKQPVRRAYRTLLVPVDFSPSSLASIRIAQVLAPKAEIILMHAFDIPFESRLRLANVSDDIINHYRVVARQQAQKDLYDLRESAGLSTGKTRFVVVHGDASLRVLEQEQAFDCDLIVMGKHGRSPLEELIVGSVTKKVLAESQCDVLVSTSE